MPVKSAISAALTGLVVSAVLASGAAQAGPVLTQTQTAPFSYSFSAFTNTTDEQVTFFTGPLQTNFQPFDAGLGVLQSVIVTWTFDYSFSGTTGDNIGNELPSGSTSGFYSIGGDQYDGNGGGHSNGAAADTLFTDGFSIPNTYTFTAAAAGVSYNPNIWLAFTGASPFSAAFGIGAFTETYNNIASGSASVSASVTIEYDYVIPEPGSMGLMLTALGLLGSAQRRRGVRSVRQSLDDVAAL